MTKLRRFAYFIVVNMLVMLTISIAFNLFIHFFGVPQFAGYYGSLMVMSLFWGIGGAFLSLMISKWTVKKMMGVRVLDPASGNVQDRELLEIVGRLTKNAGLAMPEVGVYEAPEINAFATGRSRNSALVCVSTGLLTAMNHDEIEGVLGHEIAHVANGDMVTMTLVQGVVNSFVLFFSRVVAGIIAQNAAERNRYMIRWVLSMLFDILFGILGSIVVCYFSRAREFRADAGGAKFAGRAKMISALRRLQAQYEQIPADTSSVGTLKISSRPAGVMALFGTHPSLDQRIARLEQASV